MSIVIHCYKQCLIIEFATAFSKNHREKKKVKDVFILKPFDHELAFKLFRIYLFDYFFYKADTIQSNTLKFKHCLREKKIIK